LNNFIASAFVASAMLSGHVPLRQFYQIALIKGDNSIIPSDPLRTEKTKATQARLKVDFVFFR
jgi:hypothetical protein